MPNLSRQLKRRAYRQRKRLRDTAARRLMQAFDRGSISFGEWLETEGRDEQCLTK